MAHDEVKHEYHLVEPSAWPIIGSIGAFILAVGAIAAMHGGAIEIAGLPIRLDKWALIVGALIVAYTMFGWWADVVKEAQHGDHTPIVQLGLRYGMLLFIASEVMFFVAWFWAYFDAALFPGEVHQFMRHALTGCGDINVECKVPGVWPPHPTALFHGTFNPWDIPFINTLVLLTSGTTVTWAHHAILHNDRKGLVRGLALTVVLGMLFTSLQAYEYIHAGFSYSGHIYGATFFMATGFHGFHVIIGTIFLAVCLFRAMKGQFTPQQHFGLEAAAWYWHFVDVVWLFLFTSIYVLAAGTPLEH